MLHRKYIYNYSQEEARRVRETRIGVYHSAEVQHFDQTILLVWLSK